MEYVFGFLVWLGIGVVIAVAVRQAYRGPDTLRPGGLIGATAGALVCSYLYHFVARRTA